MRHSVSVVVLSLLLAIPALAEPGVVLLVDTRQPGQTEISAQAKRYLGLLVSANQLSAEQFSLQTLYVATPEGRRFQRTYQLTSADLPALATTRREGNRIELRQTLRRYTDPLAAAELAFRHLQADEPRLITETSIWTGAELSSTPVGATVLMGQTELGLTPCQVKLPPGRHQLRLVHPDCLSQDVILELKAGDTVDCALSLLPAPAEFVLSSSGPPLDLTLDGRHVGRTPLALPVDAGLYRLRAEGPEVHPVELELHAAAQMSTQVTLQPIPRKVRVGLVEIDADGYLIGPGYDPLPLPSGNGVSFDDGALVRQLESQLGSELSLVPADSPWECGLKLDVDAWEYDVTASLEVVSRNGEVLHTLSAERRMPWLKFQAEQAARKRAADMVKELTDSAAEWIAANVEPVGLGPEQARHSLERRPLPALLP